MAGDWIKMRSNLHEDPRVVQIASELGADELHVVGMLWRAWSWADNQTLDGNAVSVTETFLDRIVRRDGFAAALRKVDWLEGRNGALTFPRFAEHNGQTAKSRALTTERVRKKRNAASVTGVTPQALPEKRREEKNTDNNPPPPSATAGESKDARHSIVTSRWGELYRGAFGSSYVFQGRDAATLKRFLATCKDDAEDVLTIAVKAWERTKQDRFASHCKHAATVHGLCTFYNDIRLELKTPTQSGLAIVTDHDGSVRTRKF